MKRSCKFYRKNEAEVMEQLGLKPTANSGSGWIEKEDGQSDEVICQLKSTDAESIKVNKKDVDTLEHNAEVSHKIPVFAIQFIKSNKVYLVVSPELIPDIATFLTTGFVNKSNEIINPNDLKVVEAHYLKIGKVKSSECSRKKFFNEREKKFQKEKKAK